MGCVYFIWVIEICELFCLWNAKKHYLQYASRLHFLFFNFFLVSGVKWSDWICFKWAKAKPFCWNYCLKFELKLIGQNIVETGMYVSRSFHYTRLSLHALYHCPLTHTVSPTPALLSPPRPLLDFHCFPMIWVRLF